MALFLSRSIQVMQNPKSLQLKNLEHVKSDKLSPMIWILETIMATFVQHLPSSHLSPHIADMIVSFSFSFPNILTAIGPPNDHSDIITKDA